MTFISRLAVLLLLTASTFAYPQTSPLLPDPLSLPTPRPASKGAYQYGIEMLKLDKAWAITKGRAHVATADSGFVAHPELSPGIDGNFRTHLSQTAHLVGQVNFFHATMVAGVLAARGFDGTGISGACAWCSLTIHVGSPRGAAGNSDVVTGVEDAIVSGTSVINVSFGDVLEVDPAKQRSCDGPGVYAGDSLCRPFRHAEERDVVVVAIAQNQANLGQGPTSDRIPLPANIASVVGVGGVDSTGKFWDTSYDPVNLPGSSWGAKIRLVAPAKDVLTLQVPDKYLYDYKPYRCGDRVDAPTAEAPTLPASYTGYGDCMGTSFAAPMVAGIAGLIRSVNPLLSAPEVRNILNNTATQPVAGPAGSGLTFYLPDAEKAVQAALGPGVTNRLSPMFSLYASDTQTHLFTSSPQTAVAGVAGELKVNGQTTGSKFASFGDPVDGYSQFAGRLCDLAGNNCVQSPARSLFSLYTTEASPDGVRTLVPLFRMSLVCAAGSAGCKTSRTFAYATSRAQVQALETRGYAIDMVEGYIFSPQGAAPAGTQMLCMAFDSTRIDHILYTGTSCNKSQLVNGAGQNTGGNYGTPVTLGFVNASSLVAANYTDLWFNAAESGWGIHITHHNQQLFGAWFTYDELGNQLFITMPGCNLQPFDGTTCGGDLYRTTGPSYRTAVFNPALVTATKVGSATVTFTGQDTGTFNYRIGAANITKSILRQPYGSAPRTTYPTDLSDHFYRPDASGWGVAVAEHGNKSFTVIYHYDTNGNPMFATLPDSQTANGSQTGKLYRTRSLGSNYLSPGWNPADIVVSEVGTAVLRASGAQLDFQFTIDGYAQQHLLTRLPF